MAETVKADVAQLVNVGQQYAEYTREVHKIKNYIEGVVGALKGPGWAGAAADAAVTVMTGQLVMATKLANLLDHFGTANIQGGNELAGSDDQDAARMRALQNSPGGQAGVVPGVPPGGSGISSTLNPASRA